MEIDTLVLNAKIKISTILDELEASQAFKAADLKVSDIGIHEIDITTMDSVYKTTHRQVIICIAPNNKFLNKNNG